MLEAPDSDNESTDDAAESPAGPAWWKSLQSNSTRRGLLLTALGGLLIAGLVTALPNIPGSGPIGLTTGTALGGRTNATFDTAKAGDCLNWPERTPDDAGVVDCNDEHRFEVAESIDMRTFPGSEYGPDAAPPSQARIQQISQEQCGAAIRSYLGTKFDPNGKFTVSLLWSGDKAWRQAGERRMLCGLQLPGPNNQQLAYRGKIANLDQSQVWAAGTCLGIDPATNQPTDIPVDCAAPHAMEVTGSVNLAEKFPGGLPPENEQDTFIKDVCTRMTDAYLAPVELRSTTLTLIYGTISLPSWSAGSHQVSCSIGATLGNGGWSTLLNSAKGPLVINGRPPVAPPEIPEERLNLPPIPMTTVDTSSQTSEIDLSQQSQGQGQQSSSQHLPGQQQQQTSTAPTSEAPGAPAQGNTFLNGAPPPPGGPPQDGPPPPGAPIPPPGDAPPPPAPVDPAAPPVIPPPGEPVPGPPLPPPPA